MQEGNPPTLEYRPSQVACSPVPLWPAIVAALFVGLSYAGALLLAMELIETDADKGPHAAAVRQYVRVVEFPLVTLLHPSSKDAFEALLFSNGSLWSISAGLAWRARQRWARRRPTP